MSDFKYCPRTDGDNGPYGIWHLKLGAMEKYLQEEPWKLHVPPFRCAPHVWQVSGFTDVNSFLLDSGDGLILIDVPCFPTLYLQMEAIRTAGFDPHDIRYIFLTHGHGDHYGALRPMQEYTGAKVFMPKADEEDMDRQRAAGTLRVGVFGNFPFKADAYYSDEEPIRLGNLCIRTRTCPGHTPGSTAFFFDDVDQDGTVYHVAMHGGLGSTASTAELKKRGYPQWFHQRFIDDCREMADLDVDICLASHENQTNFLSGVNEKDRSDFSGFVDKTVWRNLMLQKAADVEALG